MSLWESAVKFAWEKHLEPALQDAAKDTTKSEVKSLLSEALKRLKPSSRERAAKSLLSTFAKLLSDEFEDHALFSAESSHFAEDVKQFLAHSAVQSWLAEPLDSNNGPIDARRLADLWGDLRLTPLPNEFNWGVVAQRYSTRVKGVIEKDAELRAMAQSDVFGQIRKDLQRLAPLDPGFRLEEYRARIRARYGYLKFDSFHVTGSDLERRILLSKVFVPQHVKEDLPPIELPKEHIRELEAAGELSAQEAKQCLAEVHLEQYRRRYQESPSLDVLGTLRDSACPYSVVIGDPGSGKSTLLEWLLLDWADAKPSERRPLPLFVELRQCARETADWKGDFCQYFAAASDPLFAFNASQLDEHLRAHDSVLLLDGLDEVFDLNQRQRLIERILSFQQSYPRARIVITSRKIGFQKDAWLNNRFHLFTLQDFNLPQIEQFLDRWHELAFPGEQQSEIARLKPRLVAAVHDYAPIRELSGNPLLLTMMAVINRLEPIPRDRRALYERCAELLAHRWEVDRGRIAGPEEQNTTGIATLKSPLDLGDKKTLLELIACEMQSGPTGLAGNVIEEERLKTIVAEFLQTRNLSAEPGRTAREIIHQLRERNFILCFVGARRYAFVHRTFLEYFCASYFAQRLDGKAILEEVVRPHWRDERWHEVIRLVVAEKSKQPETVRAVIEFLLTQNTVRKRAVNLFLAAECAADLRNPAELGATRDQLLAQLKQCFRFELDYYHEAWQDEQALVNGVRARAGTRWALLQPVTLAGKTELIRLVRESTADANARRAVMQELARGWKDDAEVLVLLKERVRQDDDASVRQGAVQELARGWKKDAEVLVLLKERAWQDGGYNVCRAAVQELARGWKEDAGVLAWLKEMVREEDVVVRRAALQELARGWKDDAEVLVLLKERVRQDDNASVRQAALQELARGWKEDAEVLPLLKERVRQDDDASVRQAALQELARGWKEDAEVLAWLKERVRQDNDASLRRAAVQELARGWKEDAEVLPLLKERVRQDGDYHVRGAVVQELARGWKEDAGVLPLLKERARQDGDYHVRRAAMEELARGWKEDAEVLPWLKEQALEDEDWSVRQAAVKELGRVWGESYGSEGDVRNSDEPK